MIYQKCCNDLDDMYLLIPQADHVVSEALSMHLAATFQTKASAASNMSQA